MKKIILIIASFSVCIGLSAQTVKLPAPKKDASMTLSDLLWAAVGINRPNGMLTAPTAMNSQEVRLYVCRADGAYEYIAKDNSLVKVSDKDLRNDVAGFQTGVSNAPLFLVITADLNRYSRKSDHSRVMGAVDVGYVSQNVCLACEALGLSTVPRATMNAEVLTKELKLVEDQLLLINHPVGYKK